MEMIVNFVGCSDCDALNSRLREKKLSCEASGYFLKGHLGVHGGVEGMHLTTPCSINQISARSFLEPLIFNFLFEIC